MEYFLLWVAISLQLPLNLFFSFFIHQENLFIPPTTTVGIIESKHIKIPKNKLADELTDKNGYMMEHYNYLTYAFLFVFSQGNASE